MTARMEVNVRSLTVRQLLRLTAQIVTELKRRDIVRSRNAPAGDLAEYLVVKAYQGVLAAPAVKSWDVQVGDRKQVKCRLIDPGDRRSPLVATEPIGNASFRLSCDAELLWLPCGVRSVHDAGAGRAGDRCLLPYVRRATPAQTRMN